MRPQQWAVWSLFAIAIAVAQQAASIDIKEPSSQSMAAKFLNCDAALGFHPVWTDFAADVAKNARAGFIRDEALFKRASALMVLSH